MSVHENVVPLEPAVPASCRINVRFTPGMAQDAISNPLNPPNRPTPDTEVAAWVRRIAAGRVDPDLGEPIIFGPRGELLNGKTRLTAVAKGGLPAIFGVVHRKPVSVMVDVDQHRKRTKRQGHKMRGDGYPDVFIAWAMALHELGPLTPRMGVNQFEIDTDVINNLDAFEACHTIFGGKKAHGCAAAVVAAFVLAWRAGSAVITAGARRYLSIEGLNPGDPMLALRRKVEHKTITGAYRTEVFECAVRACAALIDSERPTILRRRPGDVERFAALWRK